MADAKTRWCYVTVCPSCKTRVEVLADAGITRDKPGLPFMAGCPQCWVRMEFRPEMLVEAVG